MKNFNDILELARAKGPKKVSVAVAHDEGVLNAIKKAVNENICIPFLIGDEEKIREISKKINFNLNNIDVIDEKDVVNACRKAVSMVNEGISDIVMKGLVDTSIILKAVLDKKIGLRTGNILSHVAVFSIEKYHKVLIITDAAMSIAPNANEKKQILENAIGLAQSLDITTPKAAVICAKEKVSPNMQATLDAQELVEMHKAGIIKQCYLEGPYALDNAISKAAAEHKGVKGDVAGDADILLMPNIEAGNVLYKSLTYFSDSDNAGVILGAKAPIVLTSRADTDVAKLNSIALAVLRASN